MFRRHPILTGLTVLFLALGAGLGVFLYNFDLDHHRVELEQRLSTALQRPVHLGRARFALHGGIALEFSDVVVGDRDEDGVLRAARLALRLELLPLLRGHLTFNRLLLDSPEYTLARVDGATAEKADIETLLQRLDTVLQTTLVRDLTLRHGLFRLIDRRQPGQDDGWEIRDIDISLTNLGRGGIATLRSSATLHRSGASTPMTVSGALDFPTTLSDWRRGRIDLRLALNQVSPDDLTTLLGWSPAGATFSGRGDLDGSLTGTPRDGLDIALTLNSQDLSLALPAFYSQPLPLRKVAIAGRWSAGAEHRLSALAAEWDGLRLGGELQWPRALGTGELIANLTLPETPIPRLLPLLPDHGAPEPLLLLRRILRDGSAEIARLRLHWPLTPAGGTAVAGSSVFREANFALRHGLLELPGLGAVSEVGFAGSWRGEVLDLQAGEAGLLGGTLHFQGQLAAAGKASPRLDLRADGTVSAAALFARLPGQPQAGNGAGVSGNIPLRATVSGNLDHLVAELKADLRHVELARGATTLKKRGTPGELFVTADLGAESLAISHFYLQSPLIDLRGNGRMGLQAGRPFLFTIDLAKVDFAELKTDIAAVNLLRPRGTISGRWVLAGNDAGFTSNRGDVVFRDLSLHLGGAVADVSAASGKLAIDGGRIAIEHVSGLVGSSRLSGSGHLGTFDHIRLDLNVSGEKIRARDLIFRSDSAVLRSVAGRVVIDGDGIEFDAVRASLDGGTSAVVAGHLRDFSKPQVDLDIVAEEANIEEVVQLWQDGRSAGVTPHPAGAAASGGLRLVIRMAAAKGNIYGLPFQQGSGLLTLEHGQLRIHPLRMRTGSGRCSGQVMVRQLANEHPLIVLSGHVEGADAAAVHNQLLRRKGLIEGNLNGDFYVQGELGRFLPSADGGFSVRIEDGVLRQFPVLAKVFSILNVSQIFALRLPDMASEGMPFDRLEGSLVLQQGVLRTADLVVDSNAMNLAIIGSGDLINNRLDLTMGVKPLRTVDKIVSSIPLAGWVLTGKEKALVTAQFTVSGRAEEPEVKAIPFTSLSDMTVGFFKRAFGLPGKVISDLEDLVGGEKK